MRRALLATAAVLIAGCAAPPPEAPRAPARGPAIEVLVGPPVPAPVTFLHDDVDGAMRRARAEGKVVFVDAWAPWCHTCLSMQSEVLDDPSLAPLADRVVFVAIDTDRPENAAFLERHAVTSWPTFFLLDPGARLLGYWPGAASLRELRDFVEEGLRAAQAPAGAPEGDPVRVLVAAHAALTRGEPAQAAGLYERAAAGLSGSPRRSEALLGWIRALYAAKDHAACARIGERHVADLAGSAAPADFASYLAACAAKLPASEQAAPRAAAIAALRRITAEPPAGASADDRADACSILADALAAAGDAEGARRANEARLAIMERAAAGAATPAEAATYDYGRAGAYVALGRADDAVRMLTEREAQMPSSYEPPARLAEVLARTGRLPEALAAIDRAIARAYGPRRLRYLKLRAELQGQLGDRAGQLQTLRDEVRGHEALARGQVNAERLAEARRRLEDAERAAAGPAN